MRIQSFRSLQIGICALAMSHAGQCQNTARRVLAHVRAYLDIGQHGECRDSEQACLRTCRHGSTRHIGISLLLVFHKE